MRFSPVHRWLLYITFGGVALSGLGWTWIDLSQGLGPSATESMQMAKSWLGRAHGAFAMLALAGFGSVLALHLPLGWLTRLRRASGLALIGATLLLAATGYLLYYASGEMLREWSAWLHIALGVAACALFIWHQLGKTPQRLRD